MDDDAFDTNAFSTDAWDFFASVIAFVRSLSRTTWVGADPRGLSVARTPVKELAEEDRDTVVLAETRSCLVAGDSRNITVTA